MLYGETHRLQCVYTCRRVCVYAMDVNAVDVEFGYTPPPRTPVADKEHTLGGAEVVS